MSKATHDSGFQTAICIAALLALPAIAHAEPAATKVIITPAVIQIPKIEVFGRAEPEDRKPATKTPIQKMQESLDKAGRVANFSVREYGYNDSTRRAQINTLSGVYCLEEKRGQIDFSGMNQARIGVAMRPVINDCR
jgi:hypothetical protein